MHEENFNSIYFHSIGYSFTQVAVFASALCRPYMTALYSIYHCFSNMSYQ